MIRSFRNKSLERFWWHGETWNIDPRLVERLRRQLTMLDAATSPGGMDLPGWQLRRLSRDRGRYAVAIDDKWRLTFGWSADGPDAVSAYIEEADSGSRA
jgi:proteic killer suppression protein